MAISLVLGIQPTQHIVTIEGSLAELRSARSWYRLDGSEVIKLSRPIAWDRHEHPPTRARWYVERGCANTTPAGHEAAATLVPIRGRP